MTASELKINDTFKKQGFTFTVKSIEQDTYKNGTPCLSIGCATNGSSEIGSFFNFKLDTKIKLTK